MSCERWSARCYRIPQLMGGLRVRFRASTAGRSTQQSFGKVLLLKAEIGGVVVLHHVALCLDAHLVSILRLRFAPGGDEVVVANDLYPDESRSEEHTSELQSLAYLVCRLLL